MKKETKEYIEKTAAYRALEVFYGNTFVTLLSAAVVIFAIETKKYGISFIVLSIFMLLNAIHKKILMDKIGIIN